MNNNKYIKIGLALVAVVIIGSSLASCSGGVLGGTEVEVSSDINTSSVDEKKIDKGEATPNTTVSPSAKPTNTKKPTATTGNKVETPKNTAKPNGSVGDSNNSSGTNGGGGTTSNVPKPTDSPTSRPSVTPTNPPTATPTEKPTVVPTEKPVVTPTEKPKEKVWVVDVAGHYETKTETTQVWVDEVGHYEDNGYWVNKWGYMCNGCKAEFSTVDDVNAHIVSEMDKDNFNCGSYSMVGINDYWVEDKQWVVDVEGHYEDKINETKYWVDEVGHWEYR